MPLLATKLHPIPAGRNYSFIIINTAFSSRWGGACNMTQTLAMLPYLGMSVPRQMCCVHLTGQSPDLILFSSTEDEVDVLDWGWK